MKCLLLNSSILMDELGRMFGIYSSGPSRPWLWIIEYLSSFPHIDISIIHGLIKAAPVLQGGLGKNTSEMVALRCLEELFGPKIGLENVAPPDSRLKGSILEIPILDGDENVPTSRVVDSDVMMKMYDEQIPIRLHGEEQLEVESGRIIKVTEIEGNNLGKDSPAGVGDQDVCVASRTLGQSDFVGHVELQDNQMEDVQNADADVLAEQKYVQKGASGSTGENIDQGFPLSSPNSTFADGLYQNIDSVEAKAVMDHPCCAEQICEYKYERFNIALKKSLFLSLQHTPSQDPVQKSGWTK
ncbi:hypothetical protein CRYUN_Cryun16bG0079400 [Craigia yunnanensis]